MGLTASIIGIASVGVKLSTALYFYTRSAARADQDIINIASNVVLTANVLDSVCKVLKEGFIASRGVLQDTDNILKRCEVSSKKFEGS